MNPLRLFPIRRKPPTQKEKDGYASYVAKIICNAHSEPVMVRQESNQKFAAWLDQEAKLWNQASWYDLWKLAILRTRNRHYVFNWGSLDKKPLNGTLVLADVFTRVFPSTHDMPEWGLSTTMAETLSLLGVSVTESSTYRVHVKHHFVNHKMVRGIIQFDLYRL